MTLKRLLKENVTSVEALRKYLVLPDGQLDQLEKIVSRFPLSVPPYYLSLIDKADPDDPVRRMSIPSPDELDPDGSFDTSGEASNTVVSGVQHKYGPTALVLSTSACAMYCRHCFRKRLVGVEERETSRDRKNVLAYIRDHKEISNVLLSGGDALLNTVSALDEYLEGLSQMEHIDAVRLCSRVPVVLPMRIYEDKKLLTMLKHHARRKRLYLITQFNHPKELTPEAVRAVSCLLKCGIVMRNQTVLLRGVNDDGQILGQLFRRLVQHAVLPYYVFQCRPVTGVKNRFQVPIRRAYRIIEEAKNRQSGLGKGFRYALSHETGKIEILGPVANSEASGWVFKYHQAKSPQDNGRLFTVGLGEEQCWLSSDDVRRKKTEEQPE